MQDDGRPDGGDQVGGPAAAGGSQLAVPVAMRARDVSRPRPEHIAAAERGARAPAAPVRVPGGRNAERGS
jgi:hypothetical protein